MIKKPLTKQKSRKYNSGMNGISVAKKPGTRGRVSVEMSAKQFEKFAVAFGVFSDKFLASIERAERQYRDGKVFKIKSLRDLDRLK